MMAGLQVLAGEVVFADRPSTFVKPRSRLMLIGGPASDTDYEPKHTWQPAPWKRARSRRFPHGGTDSSLTLRWREMDSNHQSRERRAAFSSREGRLFSQGNKAEAT
jgi:hypothetical protein